MAEQEPNTNFPRRRISFGFIFVILLTVGLIGILVYRIFGNTDKSTHLNRNDYVTALVNGRVETATITHHYGSELTTISGSYKDKNGRTNSYTFNTDSYTYNSSSFEYVITVEKNFDGTTKTITVVEYDSTGNPVNKTYNSEETFTLTGRSVNYLVNTYITSTSGISIRDVYETTWWDQWGPTIIMLAGSVIVVIFLFSRLSSSVNNSNRQAMDFNKSRARRVQDSKTRFKDVAGCDEEKAEMEEIVEYLKDPQKYTKFGAKLPKGILLVGHPGTGKTLLAKAVAGEAGVPFFSISGSDFVEMFVGVGAGRVRDMFKTAKENAPCLIFIDEIDAVGRQRGAGLGGGNDEREQTLNQLLVEMDGFSDNSGIIVMAATNRDDVLDPALLRAGRFDRKITVSLPDKEGREAIFKVHSRNKKLDKNVDFSQIAKRTVGFSGADIENIMNEAAILAVRRKKDCITMSEIDEAIDRRVAGPAKSSRSLNKHERDVVAHHEAGHAIIGLKLEHSDKVQKITIIPRGNTGGHVRMTPEEDRFLLTKRELEARIVGYLGGRSAEEVFFDDISSGAQNDIEMATRIARMMVTELGMSSLGPIQYESVSGNVFLGRDYTSTQKNFSLATAEKIDAEIQKIINDAHEKAVELIKKYKDDVELIAQTLIEHEQITAEEIDYLLEHRHLKKDEVVDDNPVEKKETTQENPQPSGEGDGE
ncbi:MAG: ATP-dependent zinc metalloprotease FtsH [Bacilli bacterium]|nr:ATP-dependent zinc metalloprotease FtsH [Bacilli bacterium]